jgi:hypothetical protein
MNLGLEGFAYARLDVDLHYLPSFSLALNKRALLGDGLVAVHVEVDLFSSWIAVVSEHDLLGGFHSLHLRHLDADWNRCGAGACSAGLFSRRAKESCQIVAGYSRDSYVHHDPRRGGPGMDSKKPYAPPHNDSVRSRPSSRMDCTAVVHLQFAGSHVGQFRGNDREIIDSLGHFNGPLRRLKVLGI